LCGVNELKYRLDREKIDELHPQERVRKKRICRNRQDLRRLDQDEDTLLVQRQGHLGKNDGNVENEPAIERRGRGGLSTENQTKTPLFFPEIE